MAKLNSIGVRAKDIDRIIDGAIQRIGTGEDKYSCCALMQRGESSRSWKVRNAYTHTFSPVTYCPDNYGYAFATEVTRATNPNTKANFRVFMLSLFRAAWRDLV
ncbi:hypothetical protein LCGC14_1531800 [marine sediment metagenome]|uniref:Uncharacterized protein n=1 Tax=marine sediment metagenome TaxID=412755 RepID=A0A0F9LBH9_9ZZZZ